MAKKRQRPATESQESDTTLIKAPLPLSSMQIHTWLVMMIKAMKMNKLSYWKLHLMLVKVKISDNDVTREWTHIILWKTMMQRRASARVTGHHGQSSYQEHHLLVYAWCSGLLQKTERMSGCQSDSITRKGRVLACELSRYKQRIEYFENEDGPVPRQSCQCVSPMFPIQWGRFHFPTPIAK